MVSIAQPMGLVKNKGYRLVGVLNLAVNVFCVLPYNNGTALMLV